MEGRNVAGSVLQLIHVLEKGKLNYTFIASLKCY